jgi:hypothetical protein
MAINFPDSPTNGETHAVGTFTWQYDGEKWVAANGIALDGLSDVTAPTPTSGDFLKWNGTAWVNDPINLSTDTVGNYMSDLTQGTGVTITHTPGEASNATIAIGQAVGTSSSVQFAAVTAPVIGNASTATTLQTARTIAGQSFDGSANISIAPTDLTGVTSTAAELNILDGATLSTTELNYVDGVTSAIQTQLNDKAPLASPTFTGTVVLPDNTVALGAKTTGDYVASLVAGTGVTLTNNSGETATPTVAIGQAVGTSASVTFAKVDTTGDLTVGGNLTVNGTTTTLNTETLSIEDNIVVLNSNVSASPSLNAGIEIERGTSTNVSLRWNEADDKWQFTNDGSTYVDFGAGGATISETAPSSPTAGQVWFESDTAQTFVYYDSQWIEIGASGMAAVVSDSAPSSPITGQIWFNSLNGGTYVYYSSAWTEVGAVPINALLNTINAKGDLLAGTADNTIGRLGVGTNGYFLKADSAETTGLVWAAIPSVSILDDVGDVTITSASSGQVLQWNGSAWINATVSTDIMTSSKNAALLVMEIGV